jgi:hypothetical protein
MEPLAPVTATMMRKTAPPEKSVPNSEQKHRDSLALFP